MYVSSTCCSKSALHAVSAGLVVREGTAASGTDRCAKRRHVSLTALCIDGLMPAEKCYDATCTPSPLSLQRVASESIIPSTYYICINCHLLWNALHRSRVFRPQLFTHAHTIFLESTRRTPLLRSERTEIKTCISIRRTRPFRCLCCSSSSKA